MFDAVPINGETWLICGGRDFVDQAMFDGAMGDLIRFKGCPARIVHGAAKGADSMAHQWAQRMAVDVASVPADWEMHGRAAGPIRNQRMLDEYKPVFVVAFPGGRGTEDMKRRAREANIEVAQVTAPTTTKG